MSSVFDLRLWSFSPTAIECTSFQILVSQEIITDLLQTVRMTEKLICWMAAMLGSSSCWNLFVYINFYSSGVHLSGSSDPDEKVGTDWKEIDSFSIVYTLITLHVARHNHIDRFRSVVILSQNSVRLHQINPVAHSIPSLILFSSEKSERAFLFFSCLKI
jgi:hypothetical protein